MSEMSTISALWPYLAGGVGSLWGLAKAQQRIELSMAKHRSLAGHPRTARRVAGWLPRYTYTLTQALAVDGAPPEVQARRQASSFVAIPENTKMPQRWL